MKKNILFLFLVSAIALLNAQTPVNDKFIEVKVYDTIKVAPDYIEAFIKMDDNETINDYNFDENVDDDKKYSEQSRALIKEKKRKEIESKISEITTNYRFSDAVSGGLLSNDMDDYTNGYTVVLNNINEYNRLKSSFNDMDDIMIITKTMELRNKEIYEAKLIEKTMNTALKEASNIAKLMNVIIDKPIAVRNFDVNSINYNDMFGSNNSTSNYMTSIFSLMGSMFKNRFNEEYIVIGKTLVVKYLYK